MKVLIIGGGGREHALAWRAARSERVGSVLVAPGNAGTRGESKVRNIPRSVQEPAALMGLADEERPDLTVIGPEAPLVAGGADALRDRGHRVMGPGASAARLEGSKAFAKAFMGRHGIPTAAYHAFDALGPLRDYLAESRFPVVLKADGLASGKGVVICADRAEAESTADGMLSGDRYGEAGRRVVVEEHLAGTEITVIALVAGDHYRTLESSQDHKARDAGDRGPNTGGMGAYSPAPWMDAALQARIEREILTPTVSGLAAEGLPYHGFLYVGLMIDDDGNPKVLEYNCRLGDPEAQVLAMRLETDWSEVFEASIDGALDRLDWTWDPRPSLGVVLCAPGYPGPYTSGAPIEGLTSSFPDGVKVFHAGTAEDASGRVVTAGGRVLCVTALGSDLAAAQATAYTAAERIRWPGVFYRRDIGYRALNRGAQ